MGKRFTETNKWADQWFRKLTPSLKLGWSYLTDNCDAAGVIELDRELADFQIGAPVDWNALVSSSEGRIESLENGRLWLTKFVAFQYGTLSEACPPHKSAIQCLRKHGLVKVLARYSIPSGSAQVKEEDKEKEKEEEGGSGGKHSQRAFAKPTLPEVQAYCAERGGKVDAAKWFAHYESNGWKVGRNPMRDWKAAVRTWEDSDYNQPRAGPNGPTSARELAKQASLARKANGIN